MPSYAVTGASRGLGLEFVSQLSEDPQNKVFALVRSPETATRLSMLVSKRSGNLTILHCDVTSAEQLQSAADQVSKATGGSLDVFIQNAMWINPLTTGLTPLDALAEHAALNADFHETIDRNVWPVLNGTNIFLPLVKASQLKRVVVLSSDIVDLDFILRAGFPFGLPYPVPKAAINIIVAKYAVLLRGEDVRFASLSPGWVDTAVDPPTSEQGGAKTFMQNLFQNYKPGFKGQMQSQESVSKMLDVIHGLTAEQSGRFLSHTGDQSWL